MLSVEEIISDIPQNAAYRQTIIQKYPSRPGAHWDDARWDIFYDEHDNEIRNICTSQVADNKIADELPLNKTPYMYDVIYKYNADGTIDERTAVYSETVRVSRFMYFGKKKAIREIRSETGSSDTIISYEYDDHDNPIKAHYSIDGEALHTDEYKYEYDEKGRIVYKVFINRLFSELIVKTWYEYDDRGNLTTKKEMNEGADFPSYEKYYYDENDRLIRQESYMNEKLLSESFYTYEFFR
ncbi:hypothetical protein [uncultured Ruminococcus sp.]|uniref:hypothetical protein n=1 Tax=uncultured Ruminococcus sp. TaxID=165186 RepID=UPI002600BF7F|nr:hypothetical protein [uncultured Ruminococcus sp.]